MPFVPPKNSVGGSSFLAQEKAPNFEILPTHNVGHFEAALLQMSGFTPHPLGHFIH